MGLKIDGIAASQAIDTSAESIDIDGLDISSLEAGEGTLNYEHRHPKDEGGSALDVLGAVTFAKKITKESDCANDRERMYWEMVELPFVYIQGELFNDEEDEHASAQAMAAAIQFYKRKKLPIVVRFSIDGHTLERDEKNKNILKRSIARDVAMTFKPANHSCKADVMDSKADLEKRQNSDDPLYYKNNGQYRFPGVAFSMLPDDESPVAFIKSELEILNKALAAGNPNVAPGQLTGGAAIQSSDVRLFTNKVKGAFRDWNGKTNLKDHIKKSVPEATDSFLDKFADLVDTLHLKKAIELHDHMESIMKGGALDSAVAKLPSFGDATSAKGSPKGDLNPDATNPGVKPASQQKPTASIADVKAKNLAGMQAEGHKIVGGGNNWSVNFQNGQSSPDMKATNAGIKPMAAMQSVISKFFPAKPTTMAPAGNPEAFAQVKQKQMGHMANEGWNISKGPTGNWTATPPIKKAEGPMIVSVGGRFLEPTNVQTSFFDDLSGQLYDKHGVFPVHIPGRDPQSQQAMAAALESPSISAFHTRALAGWKMLNERLRAGTLPDSIIKIGAWLMQKQLQVPDQLSNWVGNMAKINTPHQFNADGFLGVKNLIGQHRDNGKDFLQNMANGGQLALSDRNARLGLNAMGAGDVLFSDEHFIRSLFGLDHGQDQEALKVLKQAVQNPLVWNDLEKYFFDYHDAVKHVTGGSEKDYFMDKPKQALFPGAMKHFLAISAHDKAMGKTEPPSFDVHIDNPHSNLVKSEELTDVLPYVNVINSWMTKYGPMMALMMFFSMLVPKILTETTPIQAANPNGGLK